MESFFADLEHDKQFQRELFRARVGGQLASLVYSTGKTTAAIARRCGMKLSQLSRQLSGDVNLTLDTMHRIASAADATLEISFKANRLLADAAVPTQEEAKSLAEDAIPATQNIFHAEDPSMLHASAICTSNADLFRRAFKIDLSYAMEYVAANDETCHLATDFDLLQA